MVTLARWPARCVCGPLDWANDETRVALDHKYKSSFYLSLAGMQHGCRRVVWLTLPRLNQNGVGQVTTAV